MSDTILARVSLPIGVLLIHKFNPNERDVRILQLILFWSYFSATSIVDETELTGKFQREVIQPPSGDTDANESHTQQRRYFLRGGNSLTTQYSHSSVQYGHFQHHTRQQTNLNTPVVALQTPIPGLSNYTTTLGSFGAQDFSINSDLSMIASWGAAAANNAHAAQNAMNSLGQHSR